MTQPPTAFHFDHRPATIHYSRGAITDLPDILDEVGCERAMIFCGENTGSAAPLMDPIRAALDERCVHINTGSTPAKHIETAYEAVDQIDAYDVDVLIPVGGGATMDLARGIAVLASHTESLGTLRRTIEQGHSVDVPPTLLPVVGIPTTLAGSGQSIVGGARLTSEYPGTPKPDPGTSLAGFTVIDARLMPTALIYDPALFETTPNNVLAASAMNGFDKAIEIIYTRHATPITDGTGMRALRHFSEGLPDLLPENESIDATVMGLLLAQYGLAQEEQYRAAIIHAFGHGFSMYYDVTQGDIHAIMAPHILQYVFSEVDGRRDIIANGLGIQTANRSESEIAAAIVETVRSIRDALDRPTNLRGIPELDRDDLPIIAAEIESDPFMANNPVGLDPTIDDIEAILLDGW